jgi:hypothetical protein
MMRKLKALIATFTLAALATPALADCMFNGRSYPTGSVVGDRVCTASGTWQRR